MTILPCRVEEQTTRQRGVLASVLRVRLSSVAVAWVVFTLACQAVYGAVVGVLILTGRGLIGWPELVWGEVVVAGALGFVGLAVFVHVRRHVPRRVSLGRRGLWVQTREQCHRIPWDDCRWRIGTLAEDQGLMNSGSHRVAAVVIEYFDPREELRLIAVGTTPESSRRWQLGLARRGVRCQEPPRGWAREACGMAGGLVIGLGAGGILAVAHALLCRIHLAVPREGDVGAYVIVLGMIGGVTGVVAAMGDGFRLKKRGRSLAVAVVACVRPGVAIGVFGGGVMFVLGSLAIFGLWVLAYRVAAWLAPWEGGIPVPEEDSPAPKARSRSKGTRMRKRVLANGASEKP